MDYLLPLQIGIVLAIIAAGIPIARKFLPHAEAGTWHIVGITLSLAFCSLVIIIGLATRNAGIQWLVLVASCAWLAWGAVAARSYRADRDERFVAVIYAAAVLTAIIYQWLMMRAIDFPHSRAVGYPIDNFIGLWTDDVIYHLKHPDSFRLFPEWHISDRTPFFSLVQVFFFRIFGISPYVPNAEFPQASYTLRFYFFMSSCLNALIIVSGFWFILKRFGRPASRLGTIILALAPFTMINIYYSWPKSFATFFFLGALYLVGVRSRPWLIGLALALSYLSHAMYVIFLPGFFVYYYILASRDANGQERLVRTLRLFLYFLVFILPWNIWVQWIYKNPSDKFFRFPFAVYYYNSQVMASTALVLKTFFSTPLSSIIWIRVVNAVQSLVPVSLGLLPQGFSQDSTGMLYNILRYYWTTIPGTLFLSTFVVCYYALARRAAKDKIFYGMIMLLPFMLHLILFGFASDNGRGGEMGRTDAQVFGPILAGLLASEILTWRKGLAALLLAVAACESVAVLYTNFFLGSPAVTGGLAGALIAGLCVYALFLWYMGFRHIRQDDIEHPA